MKESIGYTATLNLVIVFIVIVFAFLTAALIYFKSNKVANAIVESIEKYEGYNDYSKFEIASKLTSLGYSTTNLNCAADVPDEAALTKKCTLVNQADLGYCVYICDVANNYYYYKVRTNMLINVPIIADILNVPIYSNTNRLFDFEKVLG